MTAENTVIKVMDTIDGKVPEELSHLPIDIDEEISMPIGTMEKKYIESKQNFSLANSLRRKDSKARRYKIHKPDKVIFKFKGDVKYGQGHQ